MKTEELRSLIDYNPYTGVMFWKRRSRDLFGSVAAYKMWNKRFSGKVCGTIHKSSGYVVVCINDTRYQGHRIAWHLFYGEEPVDEIDHINHKRTDNRIKNLRIVKRKDNTRNASKRITNTSGFNGVHWRKDVNKWCARITVDGKRISLGHYENKEDAAAEVEAAKLKYGYHPNHGK